MRTLTERTSCIIFASAFNQVIELRVVTVLYLVALLDDISRYAFQFPLHRVTPLESRRSHAELL